MGIAVEFGITTTLVALKMDSALSCEILPIFNAALVLLIPNFITTNANTSTNSKQL